MIRNLLTALALVIALSLLSGCGGGGTPPEVTPPPGPPATPSQATTPSPPSGPESTSTPAPAATALKPLGKDAASSAAALLAANEGKNAIRGTGDWLFSPNEIRFLSKGEFWGPRAAEVSSAANKAWADPLLGINSFQGNLKAKGIHLVMVPVPPKATIYPDMLPGAAAPSASDALPTFIKQLGEAGIDVLDLTAAMTAARADKPMHCTTDTHWSPQAIELAAEALYTKLKGQAWVAGIAKENYETKEQTIKYPGDLVELSGESIAPESFTVRRVLKDGNPLPEDPESPILVMGDSHTLFCHEPSMVTDGAGLSDHLALRFGCPVDLIGIRGSASSATRQTLLSKQNRSIKDGGNYLATKKVVIWCFTAREFSESTGGWRDLPAKYWK